LRTLPAGASVYNYSKSGITATFSDTLFSYEYVNGFIFVVPFTELTSPNASSVSVLVYAWSDDLLLQQPNTVNLPLNRKVVAEGLVVSEGFSDEKSTMNDVDVSCVVLNKSNISLNGISQLHFGEQVLSFRTLLHRYCTTHKIVVAAAAGNGTMCLQVKNNNVPSPFPTYQNSITTIPALIQYMPYAFVGVRGGVRKRFHVFRVNTAAKVADNTGGPEVKTCVTIGPITTPGASSGAWVNDVAACDLIGSVSFVPFTNGGIEYEIPYYSSNLFHFAFNSDGVGANTTNDMAGSWSSQHIINCEFVDSSKDQNTVVIETAISDDFTYFKYNGAPFYKVIALP